MSIRDVTLCRHSNTSTLRSSSSPHIQRLAAHRLDRPRSMWSSSTRSHFKPPQLGPGPGARAPKTTRARNPGRARRTRNPKLRARVCGPNFVLLNRFKRTLPTAELCYKRVTYQYWRDPAEFRYPYRPAFVNPETSHDRQSTAADTAVGTGAHFLPRASIRKEGCRTSL